MLASITSSALLVGCPDRHVAVVEPAHDSVETKNIPAVPTRDVDILFAIDNSGSMAEEQSSLRANFGKFMDVLATIEGGMPNVHIGVATSSLGQSASDGTGTASFGAGCAGVGDDGALRIGPNISGRFIIDEESAGGARTRNYAGTLADAFSALADVGTTGCGIEQHLGAAKRALSNTLNAGFLRESAKLAVIFIADEDDCSLAHKSLFEGSPDGAVVNFRCTSAGIECDGGNADLATPGLRTDCHPRPDSLYLNEVDSYVDYLKGLKPNYTDDVIVAGIIGDPDPVEIIKDTSGHPLLKPSCQYSGQYAYPAVRTADFLSQFELSVRETICEADLSKALVQIGALLKRSFGDPCFESTLADLDPDTAGLQPDCAVSDVQRLPNGTDGSEHVIPPCTLGSTTPCWRVELDEARCFYFPTKLKLVVDRGGIVPPSDIHLRASCVTTTAETGPVI
jgi:hypothetical protein